MFYKLYCNLLQFMFLQKNFLNFGGRMHDGEKVEIIRPINDDLVEVTTNNKTYYTKSVVLTCGPWINDVLKPLDLQLPIKVEFLKSCIIFLMISLINFICSL